MAFPTRTVSILSEITGSNNTANWAFQPTRAAQLDRTNPNFIRTVVLTNQGVLITRNNVQVGFQMSDLYQAAIGVNPAISWPPIITAQPSNESQPYGSTASFSVTATAETAISYQWQGNTGGGLSNIASGAPYTNFTTSTLNVSNTAGLNGHQYVCVTSDVSGVTNSAAATLSTVPNIGTQPSNQAVTAPASASFTVSATGQGSLTYQWQLSTDGGTTWANITNTGIYSGALTATLSLASTTTGLNAHKYRVAVSDTVATTVSTAATLTVT